MKTIPSNTGGRWSVAHGRELAADVVSTQNMDFNREGYATLAPAPIVIQNSTNASTLAIPVAFAGDGTNYYVITTNGIFSFTSGTNISLLSDTANQPSSGFHRDGVYFDGKLVVSGTTTVKYYAASVWSAAVSALSTNYPHPIAVFENRNELAVGDGYVIKTYNTSYVLQNTLTIPQEYTVTWLRWRQSKLYIGTRNVSGASAKLFIWNGAGSSAEAAYGVQADWIYSGCEYQSSITVLTSNGQVLRFNGGGFDPLAHFPVYETPYSWTSPSAPNSAIGKCANRGMVAVGDVLYLNIDGSLNRNGTDYPGNYLHDQPSGLWCFDPAVGLYHKAGYRYTKYSALTPTGLSSDTLSFAVGHQAETGDAVFYTTVGGLTGINASPQTYYAIKTSETSIQLAFSPADAKAGRYLTLGGSITTDVFSFNVYNSPSALDGVTPGAVGTFSNVSLYDFYGTEIMFGGRVLDASGANVDSFMSFGLGRNVGSIVTAPIYSDNVADTYSKVHERIKNLNLDTDLIKVKYRVVDRYGAPTPITTNVAGKATWIDAQSFTSDSRYKDIRGIEVGDEITILSGPAAGRTAHIATVANTDTAYTFTLDEQLPFIAEGNISEFITENWTFLETITNASEAVTQGFSQTAIANSGKFLQLKFELRGYRVALNLLQIINSINQPAV